MDVRCERCSTEYELDDDSVPEAGCPVQCTTCNHTFTVKRQGGAAPAASDSQASPAAADWLLETSDGRLHRFRNLTSLQKWIIERKVTRDDKISRTGQSWRRLGEIVELAPFFDVVDEADRARAGQAGGDDLKVEAQRARNLGSGRMSPVPPRPVVSPPALSAPPTPPPTPSEELSAIDSWAARGEAQAAASEWTEGANETAVVALRGRGTKFFVAFALSAGLAITAFFFIQRQNRPVAPSSIAATSPGIAAPGPVAAPVPVAPVPVAAVPVVAPTLVAPPVPVAAPKPTGPSTGVGARTGEDGGRAGYESSLAEADQLLENGSTEKAFKLYERALKMRPEGAEALAGLGYVMLDKGRAIPAVGYFEKALVQAPSFGPAVFGMGEALRATGQEGRALDMYRRYLLINGGGADAPAARRQVAALEEKEKAKGGREEAPPASESTPRAPPTGPPPSPSSVLNEPAAQ